MNRKKLAAAARKTFEIETYESSTTVLGLRHATIYSVRGFEDVARVKVSTQLREKTEQIYVLGGGSRNLEYLVAHREVVLDVANAKHLKDRVLPRVFETKYPFAAKLCLGNALMDLQTAVHDYIDEYEATGADPGECFREVHYINEQGVIARRAVFDDRVYQP
jgi:hypothetical protein